MRFQINFKSSKPIYAQLVDQIKLSIATGLLKPGDCLPGIRPLAEELRINRNTIVKVYERLEFEGLVSTEAGRGTFICARKMSVSETECNRRLLAGIDELIIQAYQSRTTGGELEKMLHKQLVEFVKNNSDFRM